MRRHDEMRGHKEQRRHNRTGTAASLMSSARTHVADTPKSLADGHEGRAPMMRVDVELTFSTAC
jgi:hypothetical protein